MAEQRRARPLSNVQPPSTRGLDEVRSAIGTGDRIGALSLLRAHVEGEFDLSGVPVSIGDALVATARGVSHSERASPATVEVGQTEEARARVIRLLTDTPFTASDFAEIRHVLDVLEDFARQEEERTRRKDLQISESGERVGRRIGSVWLELKYIPDADSGRIYGPYLYGRWREAGRKRSRYIGKA